LLHEHPINHPSQLAELGGQALEQLPAPRYRGSEELLARPGQLLIGVTERLLELVQTLLCPEHPVLRSLFEPIVALIQVVPAPGQVVIAQPLELTKDPGEPVLKPGPSLLERGQTLLFETGQPRIEVLDTTARGTEIEQLDQPAQAAEDTAPAMVVSRAAGDRFSAQNAPSSR
jgi:hypothetical protein